jgi:hypothetical protein
MDCRTLVAEIVKALAWPLASIALALLARRPVQGLLDGLRLKKLKRGDWEAEFAEFSTTRFVATFQKARWSIHRPQSRVSLPS